MGPVSAHDAVRQLIIDSHVSRPWAPAQTYSIRPTSLAASPVEVTGLYRTMCVMDFAGWPK